MRAVVIGGGLGGLSAALFLRRAGVEVELLEGASSFGGKVGYVTVDGIEVDTGPSLLTLPEVFEELFRVAGGSLAEMGLLRPLEDAFRYVWPDGTEIMLGDCADRCRRRLRAATGERSAQAFERALQRAQRIWQAGAPHFVFAPRPGWHTLRHLGVRELQDLAQLSAHQSLDALVRTLVDEPHLRDIFLRFATYNGSDPRRTPGTFLCIAFVEMAKLLADQRGSTPRWNDALRSGRFANPKNTGAGRGNADVMPAYGAYGVQGGMYALVRSLVALAEQAGVRMHAGTPVRRIRWRGVGDTRTADGVELASGEYVAADVVICNADAGALPALLGGADVGGARDEQIGAAAWRLKQARAQPWMASVLRRLGPQGDLLRQLLRDDEGRAQLEPSTSGFNLVVRTSRQSRRAPHTVLFPRDYLQEFSSLFDRGEVVEDPSIYVCAPERAHGRRGAADKELLFVMVNAPPLAAEGQVPPFAGAESSPSLLGAPRLDHALSDPRGGDDRRGGCAQLGAALLRRMRREGVVDDDAQLVWQRTPRELAWRFPGSRGALYGAASHSPWSSFVRPGARVPGYRGVYLASGSAHPGGGMPLAVLSGKFAAMAVCEDVGLPFVSDEHAGRDSSFPA